MRRACTVSAAVLGALLVTGVLAASPPAEACSRMPDVGLLGFGPPGTPEWDQPTNALILPADGGEAPPSTLVWIVGDLYEDRPLDAGVPPPGADAIALVVGDVEVAVTVQAIGVTAEGWQIPLFVVRPEAPLAPGPVEVRFRGSRIGGFSVAGGADAVAPVTPVGTVDELVPARFGYCSCGNPAAAYLALDRPQELVFAVAATDAASPPELAAIERAGGVARGNRVKISSPPPGEHEVRLVAFDAAGNASGWSPPIAFTMPAKESGCRIGAGGGATVWPLALPIVAFALWRGRRRRGARGA